LTDTPEDLVQAEVDKLVAEIEEMETTLHTDMQQVKGRLSALEKQVAHLGTSVAAQWESFDDHAERLYKLEHPTT
jgi:phage shock protein A